VAERLTVALSNRVGGGALSAMFADLNWWSRLRELVLVAVRPPGSGLFGPGLTSEAFTGLSALRGLQVRREALTRDVLCRGVEVEMAGGRFARHLSSCQKP
jgi:hypothetical protein